jgi:hypothetical protein
MRHLPTVVAVLTMCSAESLAQTNATKPPVPHHQIISTNPFGLLFNWFNADYERKVAPSTTIGVSAAHFDSLDYSNVALFARWYPQRAALDGFYLAARAGAYRLETYEYEYTTVTTQGANPNQRTYSTYPSASRKRQHILPGVGIDIGYNWLLGPKQNFSIGLGFGVTRLLGSQDRFDFVPVVPSARLVNVGVAF